MPEIEVWVEALSRRPGDGELLEPRELTRAARLRVAHKRDLFIAGQAFLRRVLGAHLGEQPAHLRFGYGTHGKPWLPAAPGLGFNLSHSGGLAAVAVGDATELGVDLEHTTRERPFLRLARRFFAPPEHDWLAGRPAAEQAGAFYRVWTLKEAYLKATGVGLSFPPHAFVVDLAGAEPRLVATELKGDRPERWKMKQLELAPGYAAALCWTGPSRAGRIHRGEGAAHW